jgi:hypothetical protein
LVDLIGQACVERRDGETRLGIEKSRTNGNSSAEKVARLRTKGTASAVPHRAAASEGFRVCVRTSETAGPSTTLPRISCEGWWRWRTSCAFPYRKAHARPCPVLRSRKSGFAPVGMTILSQRNRSVPFSHRTETALTLSSRPERSVVEGPAVSLVLTQTLKPWWLLLKRINSSPYPPQRPN